MKLSWGLALSSACASAAAAKAGHVFLLDPARSPASETPASVGAQTARLILAQRLGLSRFHSLTEVDAQAAELINRYGGSPQISFSAPRTGSADAHALVWIDNNDEVPETVANAAWTSQFTIEDPPSAGSNADLIRDLIQQAESLPAKHDPTGSTYAAAVNVEALLNTVKKAETHNDWLSVLHANQSDVNSAELVKALDLILEEAAGVSVTVVFMPTSSSKSKRGVQPYGTYEIPASREVRRQTTEEFMSLSSSRPSTAPAKSDIFATEGVVVTADTNNTSRVLGILPPYFSTEEACVKQTHNCSDHGACAKVRKGTGGKDGIPERWQCQCKATKVHVGKDKGMESKYKTTYWGGPACQKKDVSQPFWLFVATGLLLAFLISAGIGLLYSIGAEELPSVIGAGVSGPVARK